METRRELTRRKLRWKRIHKTITDTIIDRLIDPGLEIEFKRVEEYCKSKKSYKLTVDLLRSMIPLFRREISVSISLPGVILQRLNCTVRGFYFDLRHKGRERVILYHGRKAKGVVRKYMGLEYALETYYGRIIFLVKNIIAVEHGAICFKDKMMITIMDTLDED